MAQNAASAMDTAGNVGGITPDGVYFIRNGKLTYYRYDELGGGGGTAGNGLPDGGNIGDVLVKTGAADYAAGWAPQAGLEIHSYEMSLASPRTTLSVDIPADIFSAGKLFLLDGIVSDCHILSTIMTAASLENGNYFVTTDGKRYEYSGVITNNGDSVNIAFVAEDQRDWVSGQVSGGTTYFPTGLKAIMHVLSAATATQGPQGEQGIPGPAGQGVPAGGTTGQVLVKSSDTDYETKWVAPAGGESFVWEKVVDIPTTQLTFDVSPYYSKANVTIDVERVPTDADAECYLLLKSGSDEIGSGYNPFSAKSITCLAILGSNANIMSVEADYRYSPATGVGPNLALSLQGAGSNAPSHISSGIICGEFWVKKKVS